jgi:hypothetical protein
VVQKPPAGHSFYAWQEQFFAGAQKGFDKKRGPQVSMCDDGRVEALESDVNRMREVIAEITSENIAFKKRIWHFASSSKFGAPTGC